MLSRRSLLIAAPVLVAAPAIVRASNLMPVVPVANVSLWNLDLRETQADGYAAGDVVRNVLEVSRDGGLTWGEMALAPGDIVRIYPGNRETYRLSVENVTVSNVTF